MKPFLIHSMEITNVMTKFIPMKLFTFTLCGFVWIKYSHDNSICESQIHSENSLSTKMMINVISRQLHLPYLTSKSMDYVKCELKKTLIRFFVMFVLLFLGVISIIPLQWNSKNYFIEFQKLKPLQWIYSHFDRISSYAMRNDIILDRNLAIDRTSVNFWATQKKNTCWLK